MNDFKTKRPNPYSTSSYDRPSRDPANNAGESDIAVASAPAPVQTTANPAAPVTTNESTMPTPPQQTQSSPPAQPIQSQPQNSAAPPNIASAPMQPTPSQVDAPSGQVPAMDAQSATAMPGAAQQPATNAVAGSSAGQQFAAPANNPALPVDAHNGKPGSKKNVLLITGGIILMVILGAVVGYVIYSLSSENSDLSAQLEESKQVESNLKNTLASDGNVQTLLGPDGEQVAGASSEVETGGIYIGQAAVSGDKLLVEVYVDYRITGPLEAVWVSYGSNQSNLSSTNDVVKGINTDQDTDLVVIEIDRKGFDAGSTYFYKAGAKTQNGETASSSFNVFTMPGQPSSAKPEGEATPNPEESGL